MWFKVAIGCLNHNALFCDKTKQRAMNHTNNNICIAMSCAHTSHFLLHSRVNRIASRDVTIKGVNIKKGMPVNIPVFGIHRDPTKWPEPLKFDPDRYD